MVFTFEAGQQCFTQHHVPDRPQFFVVRDGDWRGNPTGQNRLHTKGSTGSRTSQSIRPSWPNK